MNDWQERVVDERQELESKLEKLTAFLESDQSHALNPIDWELMVEQQSAMQTYSEKLAARIERFDT